MTIATMLGRLPGADVTIAVGDGVGAVDLLDDGTTLGEALTAFALERRSVSVILGWSPVAPRGLDPNAFTRIFTLMPGWGVRGLLPNPATRSVPVSMAAIPALLTGHLRPDALITRMAPRGAGLQFCTEVSWQQALVDAGVSVWAVVDDAAGSASAEPAVDRGRVTVVGHTGEPPAEVPSRAPDPIHYELADQVLQLIPPGASVQYGPGQLGTALLQRTTNPLRIDTGLLTDAVIDLDRRGLLVGSPSATYLLGSRELYRWAEGRPILRGIEHSHDVSRLSRGAPFVAVNTAIEIDPFGQINVEGVGEKVVGGIGGHPDYCTAARLNPSGLSIIAVPTRFNGRSPLVEQLSRPASTPAHDVEIIVTEHGYVDLRSADWSERRAMITDLFARGD
ncbi:acetyl-CoA hydrolase [Mycobacterium sp. CBMA 234]|uniref:acetyl-CoA hydrolase/transferase C-terminal domain-containing protein n=1 Tax=Mycolicibacterium sp. CBMA 234 TaxID=1918495 RepID=UPI0012DC3D7A|nr:acetyl-CoA hydrolase/transferase C-terminal domain-containing protein [Mycolicibacterium sp. CBMA 234]MUL67875.1 acetyl-CoA hydrolase [Mycolicibacterium sp. CBMA 234]